jgi:hypothetical protein
MMSRCGLNPDEYFDDEDFNCIFDFNTLDTVNTMGTAVSELSRQVLREIEVAIKKYERQKTAERSTESDSLNIQQERRLYASGSETSRAAGGTDREVRPDAPELHQGTQKNTVQRTNSEKIISCRMVPILDQNSVFMP